MAWGHGHKALRPEIKPSLRAELKQLGYETADDMRLLPIEDILRIPGMGGRDWRKIAAAMGREPYPNIKKRQ